MKENFNEQKFEEIMTTIERLMDPKTGQETLDGLKQNITDWTEAYHVHMLVSVVNDWKTRRDYMMSILPKRTLDRLIEIEKRING